MAVGVSLLVALLLANPVSQASAGPSDGPDDFYPGLVDINEVNVVVEVRPYPNIDPNGAEFSSQLEKAIRARLEASGIGISDLAMGAKGRGMRDVIARKLNVDPNSLQFRWAGMPVLHASVEVVSPGQGGSVVLCVHTSFARPVRLDRPGSSAFQATVWSAGPAAECVQSPSWQDKARTVVLGQVDSFVAARKAASHEGRTRTSLGPPAASGDVVAASPGSFVASNSGTVFHRADCRWAQSITGGNRVDYKTRQEAVLAGKRPCRTCQP